MKVEEKLWKCVKNNIVGNEICLQRKKTRVNGGSEVDTGKCSQKWFVQKRSWCILLLQFV